MLVYADATDNQKADNNEIAMWWHCSRNFFYGYWSSLGVVFDICYGSDWTACNHGPLISFFSIAYPQISTPIMNPIGLRCNHGPLISFFPIAYPQISTPIMDPIGLCAIMVLWLVFFFSMASVHCHKTKLYFAMIDSFVVWYFRQYLSPQGFCSIPLQLLPLHKLRWVTHSWHFRKWSWTFTFCFLALRMIRTMKFP